MGAVAATRGIEIIRKDAWVPDEIRHLMREWSPRTHLGRFARECLRYLPADMAAELIDRFSSVVIVESSLSLIVKRGPESLFGRPFALEDYGVVGRKVVTDAGVAFIVDAFQNTKELENLKYHALGTGSTAEAAGDTALVTELTTEYTGNVRATGTTAEGASANIYSTVATNTLDGTPGTALREHGIFDQAATGGGTLLDRTVFAAITLSSGDGLQSTYQLTLTSGS